ncbi:MAG: hypothetical protein ACRBFS_19160 [Aureispira sp.]
MKPIKEYDGQFIGTQFFFFFFLLFPLQSYFFVDGSNKIAIGWYKPHLVKIYVVFISAFSALFCLLKIGEPRLIASNIPVAYAWIGLPILLLTLIYAVFFLGKVTEEEKALRDLYGNAIGINALPKYLSKGGIYEVLNKMNSQFEYRFNRTWEIALEQGDIREEEIPLLFAILGYERRVKGNPSIEAWYEKIYQIYKKAPVVPTDRPWKERFPEGLFPF